MTRVKKTKVQEKNEKLSMDAFAYFPSLVYKTENTTFLDLAKTIAKEKLEHSKNIQGGKLHDLYPVVMSDSFHDDPRVDELVHFVAQMGWNILDNQGYDMNLFNVYVQDFWAQEHYKHSHNEEHIHPFGSQLTGFYLLECPENCSNIVFHDPRPAKKQINLPEKDMSIATPASVAINFPAKPGTFMFTNSWLPHAFGRHGSNEPFIFIHFNLSVVSSNMVNNQICRPLVEVI
jgi:uncharacterized protein (TIGR02466 family)